MHPTLLQVSVSTMIFWLVMIFLVDPILKKIQKRMNNWPLQTGVDLTLTCLLCAIQWDHSWLFYPNIVLVAALSFMWCKELQVYAAQHKMSETR